MRPQACSIEPATGLNVRFFTRSTEEPDDHSFLIANVRKSSPFALKS
jgi:hypothetical protein